MNNHPVFVGQNKPRLALAGRGVSEHLRELSETSVFAPAQTDLFRPTGARYE